jgi:hypothetical protein
LIGGWLGGGGQGKAVMRAVSCGAFRSNRVVWRVSFQPCRVARVVPTHETERRGGGSGGVRGAAQVGGLAGWAPTSHGTSRHASSGICASKRKHSLSSRHAKPRVVVASSSEPARARSLMCAAPSIQRSPSLAVLMHSRLLHAAGRRELDARSKLQERIAKLGGGKDAGGAAAPAAPPRAGPAAARAGGGGGRAAPSRAQSLGLMVAAAAAPSQPAAGRAGSALRTAGPSGAVAAPAAAGTSAGPSAAPVAAAASAGAAARSTGVAAARPQGSASAASAAEAGAGQGAAGSDRAGPSAAVAAQSGGGAAEGAGATV